MCMYACICVYYVCVYVRRYVHKHEYIYSYIRTSMSVCSFVCMCAFMYICMSTCVCMYIFLYYICVYVCVRADPYRCECLCWKTKLIKRFVSQAMCKAVLDELLPRSRIFLEKLTVAQLSKKFPLYYGTRIYSLILC